MCVGGCAAGVMTRWQHSMFVRVRSVSEYVCKYAQCEKREVCLTHALLQYELPGFCVQPFLLGLGYCVMHAL